MNRPKFKAGQVVARTEWIASGRDGTFVRLKEYNACGPVWYTDDKTPILEALLRPLTKMEAGRPTSGRTGRG